MTDRINSPSLHFVLHLYRTATPYGVLQVNTFPSRYVPYVCTIVSWNVTIHGVICQQCLQCPDIRTIISTECLQRSYICVNWHATVYVWNTHVQYKTLLPEHSIVRALDVHWWPVNILSFNRLLPTHSLAALVAW